MIYLWLLNMELSDWLCSRRFVCWLLPLARKRCTLLLLVCVAIVFINMKK